MDKTLYRDKYTEIRNKLLAARNSEGYWTGRLSSSALSTAVAIVAMKIKRDEKDVSAINAGYDWLCRNINPDGGYGDTPGSVSNISTTLLSYAALIYCSSEGKNSAVISRTEAWLKSKGVDTSSEKVTSSILYLYGKDRTFSIPILSMLTLCGAIPADSIDRIPVLPFELTLLPASFYRFVNLQVVSYALPALIGVGIYLHRKRRRTLLKRGIYRELFVKKAVAKLREMVPESGGFLEAIPLTGFVAMCLVASGEGRNMIVEKGLEFLRVQQRNDGSWPIDTDLSTWVTTLSVKALGPDISKVMPESEAGAVRDHLLKLQYKTVHPFNSAMPGGWGWTSYSGSVPDADDTPGALLALEELFTGSTAELQALENGCFWLAGLQNNDGGFPTFCRGWGKLPFDRSCADLTGHALLALIKCSVLLKEHAEGKIIERIDRSIEKALSYLEKNQADDGSWLPLWFGNQNTTGMTNPVYGTAKVCIYLKDCLRATDPRTATRISKLTVKAWTFLLSAVNSDGSWGGNKGVKGSVEETSLAVSALARINDEACVKGLEWIGEHAEMGASPIGLYFSLLWYDEELYPLVFYTEALRRYLVTY